MGVELLPPVWTKVALFEEFYLGVEEGNWGNPPPIRQGGVTLGADPQATTRY